MRRRTDGGAQAETLAVLALVGAAGLAGMAGLGRSAADVLAASGSAKGSAALVTSTQAGVEDLARVGELFRGDQLVRVPRPSVVVADAVHTPAEVSRLRDAAHALWLGEADEGTTAVVQTAQGDVTVGALPRFADVKPGLVYPSYDFGHHILSAPYGLLEHQERRFLDLLDSAFDAAFARGQTGQRLGGSVLRPGIPFEWSEYPRSAYTPVNAWRLVVHGQPTHFEELAHGVTAERTPREMAAALRDAGHEPGQPVVAYSCHTGECLRSRHNAAQRLADELDAPVIAPSDRVARVNAGRPYVFGSKDWVQHTVGEWRLFTPTNWGDLPAAADVVIGRTPAEGQTLLGAVTDLHRLPAGQAEHIRVAGHWNQVLRGNEAALRVARHALAPGGELTLDFLKGAPVEKIADALTDAGFRSIRWDTSDHVHVVAKNATVVRP